MDHFKEAKKYGISWINDHLFLVTGQWLTEDQEEWEYDESKHKDYSTSEFWLMSDDGQTTPVSDMDDIKEYL